VLVLDRAARLIGPDGLLALQNGDASITVIDQANGLIRITIANAKTARECGRYLDALQLTIGDIVSPLWLGVILVAANPKRAMLPL